MILNYCLNFRIEFSLVRCHSVLPKRLLFLSVCYISGLL